MNYKQYVLNIGSFQCNFELYLNEVLIESEYEGNNLSYASLLNHWLKMGVNTLACKLSPIEGEEMLRPDARVELRIDRSLSAPRKGEEMHAEQLLEWSTQDISGRFKADQTPVYIATTPLLVDQPLSLPWEDGVSLELNERTLAEARRIYYEFHRHMNNKNADGMVTLTMPKIKSCAQVLNWDVEEDIIFTTQHYNAQLSKPGFKTWSLEDQMLIPHIYGHQKLFTFRNEKHQPPLLQYNPDAGTCIFYDMMLYRPSESSPLIIIR